MDVHRSFAQVAILEDGRIVAERRVELVQEKVLTFGRMLQADDEIVLEATGNTAAIERLLRPFVSRVVIANPRMVRAIAYARVKTDKIDAVMLARLQAAGFLPEVWAADDDTVRRRRQATERMGLLEETVRLKSRIHAILHANLVPFYKGELFGPAGQRWLAQATLPDHERRILDRLVEELRHTIDQLAALDRELARLALADERAVRLMTIPGIGPIVATMVLSAIGDISRFASPQKLASYFGLTPKVRQSGESPARHGHISKQGNASVRKMLVEAAWSARTAPGPLRAFFVRVNAKRGPAAAIVATARKLAVLIWHVLAKGQDYAFARPAFQAMKLRKVALKAGAPREYGKAGPGRDYWIKEIRQREMEYVKRAEEAYARMVEAWREVPPGSKKRSC
ncbi:IS110 family transposase [Acidiphilium sp. AL]|uniref:IS110 family transposase n=1 Tax=Acidiphilium sp. AL TaxID=2871704 RepID=UPI0021CAEAFA|nr:IS110 family transposase [Acidiphilium sp. AL]MCU4162024.1 IS110 family transposase [Acidiphilium sp. AL]